MLKKICRQRETRLLCAAAYAALLSLAVLHSLLFAEFTNLTGEAQASLGRVRAAMNLGVFLMALGCSVLELAHSVPRALLALLLLALRWRAPVTWQSGMLLDTALLAALSDLGGERVNGMAWLISHLLYLALLGLLLYTGHAAESNMEGRKGIWIFQVGHSFGMAHANTFAVLLCAVWMMVWVLFLPKKGGTTLLFFWLGACAVYAVTLCRTAVGLLAVFPLVSMALDAVSRSKKAGLLRVCAALPLLLMGVTLLMGLQMRQLKQVYADGAFWLRFVDVRTVLKDGLTLFGSSPTAAGFFDNVYLWLLMYCGLIPTVAALFFASYMLDGLARRRRMALLAVAVLFLGYGLMENTSANAVICFAPLMAFANGADPTLLPKGAKA